MTEILSYLPKTANKGICGSGKWTNVSNLTPEYELSNSDLVCKIMRHTFNRHRSAYVYHCCGLDGMETSSI